jgi:hypothetical protein
MPSAATARQRRPACARRALIPPRRKIHLMNQQSIDSRLFVPL